MKDERLETASGLYQFLDDCSLVGSHEFPEGPVKDAATRLSIFAADGEENLPLTIRLRGILKALRVILDTPEGASILSQAVTVKRRGDDWHNARTPLQRDAKLMALALFNSGFGMSQGVSDAVDRTLASTKDA